MQGSVWAAIGECVIAAIFLVYGLTRKPLEFNALNPIKKPLSVVTARLIYLPIGTLFLFFGVRDLFRAIR